MKGKLNKIFATTALATALVVGSIIPTFADESSSAVASTSTNQTKVNVAVTKDISNVSTISVTVPTVLTLAVVADDTDDNEEKQPEVYIGSDTESGTSGTANESSLTFKNLSKDGSGNGIAVTVDKVTVTVNGSSDWTLIESNEEGAAHQMSIVLTDPNPDEKGSVTTVELGTTSGLKGNDSRDVDLGFTLEAPTTADLTSSTGKTTSIPIAIEAYGKNSDYEGSEDTAEAFTVKWVISTGTSDDEDSEDE